MATLYPLRFHPILRRYLWGGRRLGSELGKPIGPEADYAESWEVVDHGPDQSVVRFGPLAGLSLGELVHTHGEELLGKNHPQTRFPLLLKFLDAARTLSVQVHPNDQQAARLDLPDSGKTEAWLVLDAGPEAVIYAGLGPGVDRNTLAKAVREGRVEQLLHKIAPRPGDCLLLPAGTVHALGAGLLVAEIQQASDTTFRLFDWNRVGPDGRPRELHVEQALEVIDFARGPVMPQVPRPLDQPGRSRLVECEKFVLDRWELEADAKVKASQQAGGDARCHILSVIEGCARLEGDPADQPLTRGQTVLLPAAVGPATLEPQPRAVVLDACLP